MAKKKKEKDTEVKSGGGSIKFVIILLISILLVGGGVGGGVYFLMKGKQDSGTTTKAVAVVKPAYFDLGEFVVNLTGDRNTNKYLKTSLKVSYDSTNKDLATELTELQPELKSITLEYLQSKKQEDFFAAAQATDAHSLEITKKQLVELLDKKLTKGRFIEVLTQDLIIQ
ncbi:flagellar basal body-associated FliL family protein [Inconstantimicrobium mannanitabidum]|uniref:Uncharacterized protein n=1 Tax=Inconstantimicrobium mannanitabidum TaxID=1604901 RepID=A0ACB5R8I3_9CLOT|nr:flagellar basal body-associated FliL family protein [Clostridium sp. TW13]GKX65498.1 hypothetical protein rsdtw13_07560 [Clostridium sp. TW13]